MKIIILHGEDSEKSYERLKKFIDSAKERSWEVTYLDESPLSLKENLSTRSLFGKERFFILSNYRSLTPKDLTWLSQKYKDLLGNLVVYDDDVISPTILKTFPKESRVEEYKLPKILWAFLEEIRPGNSKKTVTSLHKIVQKDPPEFIFSLLSKQVRDLFWVLTSSNTIPYPSWKVGKLRAQASKFDEETLMSMIEKLAEMDFEVKTGKADLVSSLDLVLLKYLQ